MIALDTETTGVDFFHGSAPFFVSTCSDTDVQYWEWDVDPFTRKVLVPGEDLDEIECLISSNDLVLHNSKFDVRALGVLRGSIRDKWPWNRTNDTLIAGHLLASNRPHNLTDMFLQYVGYQTGHDIEPRELALKDAVKKARALCRSKEFKENYGEWRIAKAGDPDMPSAGEETWGADYWLPRAICRAENRPESDPWWTVLSAYAIEDAEATMALWVVVEKLMRQENLWEMYRERMNLPGILTEMEHLGVCTNENNQVKLYKQYEAESAERGKLMVDIAARLGHQLSLPKGGRNKNLTEFCFGPLKLPVTYYTDTGNPSLAKEAKQHWLETLPQDTIQYQFVKAMTEKTQRDTARTYMEGYRRFWKRLDNKPGPYRILHPNINATGTDTIRMSSSDPNEQNVSKKEGFNLRYIFGPPPGYEWWAMDYENIELRIPAYECGEEKMIQLFEQPDEAPFFGSYHLLNASIVFPELFWPIAEQKGEFKSRYKDTYYQQTKNGGFAIQYGCQEAKADATFQKRGAYRAIKESMPKIAALNSYWVSYATKRGYVETIPDRSIGAQRGYPIRCTRSDYGKISPTVPFNYHIQSTAMWCTCRAMVRCHNQILEWRKVGFNARIVLQVHDEIVFQLPKGGRKNLPKVRRLRSLMEESGEDIGIPLRVSVAYCPDNWSEEQDVN